MYLERAELVVLFSCRNISSFTISTGKGLGLFRSPVQNIFEIFIRVIIIFTVKLYVDVFLCLWRFLHLLSFLFQLGDTAKILSVQKSSHERVMVHMFTGASSGSHVHMCALWFTFSHQQVHMLTCSSSHVESSVSCLFQSKQGNNAFMPAISKPWPNKFCTNTRVLVHTPKEEWHSWNLENFLSQVKLLSKKCVNILSISLWHKNFGPVTFSNASRNLMKDIGLKYGKSSAGYWTILQSSLQVSNHKC